MFKSLNISNFTVFPQASFEFSPGINVIIGENATGKSHLLKLAYSFMYIWYEAKYEEAGKKWWGQHLAKKLVNVFKPNQLNHLVRRDKKNVEIKIEVNNEVNTIDVVMNFTFSQNSIKEVNFKQLPEKFPDIMPIFVPAKEVLSFYPGFISLYDERKLFIDETYYDLCKALSRTLLKEEQIQATEIELLNALEKNVLGGQVLLKGDHFYIDFSQKEPMEIVMVAEGLRKIALLTYLIRNGSLKQGSVLFWDEPESNLNPKLIKVVANSLAQLAQHNVQIILATHNLFLMKELALLVTQFPDEIPARFFSLVQNDQGITIEQGPKLANLPTIVALDEELALYDREQEAFYAKKAKKL